MIHVLPLVALLAAAPPPAGEWRLDSQVTRVKILAWGMFCGKDPADTRGIPGARYQLTVNGNEFTLKGAGKTFTTTTCGTDPAQYKPRLSDHGDNTWRVECEAPPIAGQPQVTDHRFTVVDNAITYLARGEKRKTENLEACRYAYETEMRFVLSTQAGPCANPGPAAKLVLDPATVDARPGQRVCFKVAAMDAQDCSVHTGAPALTVEPATGVEVDGNGCVWTPKELKEAALLAVTATFGDAKGAAVVRVVPEHAPQESMEQTLARTGNETVKKLVSQVTAGAYTIKTPNEEDSEPAHAAAVASAPPPDEALPQWVYIAGGGGGILVLLGLGILLLRKPKKTAKAAPFVVQPPPAAGRGYKCPKCGFEYSEPGACVHDGTTLVKNEDMSRTTMFIPQVGGMVCPTCGQRYPTRARFCGNDRTPLVPDLPKA